MQNQVSKKKADMKVVILGDASVGKTSLIQRYIEGVFTKDQITTMGASFFLKQWGPYNVAIWDTAGEERFAGLSSFYCRGASAAILAYDITERRSLKVLQERHVRLLEAAEPNCLIIMVGTKRDLVTHVTREVTASVGQKLAIELNAQKERPEETFAQQPFFETSAKTGENVQKVFDFILKTCLPLDNEAVARNSVRKTTGLDLEEFPRKQDKGSGSCCRKNS